MYHEYFGLERNLVGDGMAQDADVFFSAGHKRAAANLRIALTLRDSVAILAGPPGVGKTTIASHTLREMATRLALGWLGSAPLTSHELLEMLLTEYGFSPYKSSRVERLQTWRQFLSEMSATETRVYVLVEQADAFPPEALAALESLTAADPNGCPGANVVLACRGRMNDLLTDPLLASLKQRTRMQYWLDGLDATEMSTYLKHRAAAAGGNFTAIFAPDAIDAIHRYSGGIIRVADNLCETALAVAASEHTDRLNGELVSRVATEMLGIAAPTPSPAATPAPITAAAAPAIAAPAVPVTTPPVVSAPAATSAATKPLPAAPAAAAPPTPAAAAPTPVAAATPTPSAAATPTPSAAAAPTPSAAAAPTPSAAAAPRPILPQSAPPMAPDAGKPAAAPAARAPAVPRVAPKSPVTKSGQASAPALATVGSAPAAAPTPTAVSSAPIATPPKPPISSNPLAKATSSKPPRSLSSAGQGIAPPVKPEVLLDATDEVPLLALEATGNEPVQPRSPADEDIEIDFIEADFDMDAEQIDDALRMDVPTLTDSIDLPDDDLGTGASMRVQLDEETMHKFANIEALAHAKALEDISNSMAETLFGDAELETLAATLAVATGGHPPAEADLDDEDVTPPSAARNRF
jgi:type II secretory pathway predicted ATPase ExeA